MAFSANVISYKGKDVIELTAGKYKAIIAPFLGSNVLRLQDTENELEILRYDENLSIEELKASPEVYGMPTLYLPNRLSKGRLKTSDALYQFPINDPLGNHIHGFLHKREHSIVSATVVNETAIAKTEYIYDENDEFFETYPVSFKAEFTFTLSLKDGLGYKFTMTNTSEKMLPFGVCNHTVINAPFTKDGDGLDSRIYLPVGEKWELDSAFIPTCDFLPMTNHERQYLTGCQLPVLHDINNDVFFAEYGSFNNKPFYGTIISDEATKIQICYEICEDYKYWIIWNNSGDKGYFCPEPSTWIIDAPNLNIPPNETGYLELAPGESKTISSKLYVV
ncbi:MAG: aldose 1-epimerase [Lachnospiraceae bacterium]|nr:aldose 1-epimerase [Lachnospiraceae bacterium]